MANFSKLEDYTFARLCKTFERFEIPRFQRPYSWKNKQLQDFFSSIVENDNNYFIWNIISVYNKIERTDHFEPIQIIDWQQRITTILLLLAVIKKQFLLLDCKDKNEAIQVKWKVSVIEDLIFWRDLEDVENDILQPILSFNKKEYNNIFYKVLNETYNDIDTNKIWDNERRIINNFHILNKLVENHIKKDPLLELLHLLTKVRELQIIFIWVSNDNDVYWIFEWFNATWLWLSVADLIKNTVLRHTKSNSNIQSSVNFLWDEMEDLFSNTAISNFPKFIRYQWIANNWYISLSNLYTKINDEKIKWKSEEDVELYVKELNKDAKIFLWLMYQEYEKNLEITTEVLSEFKRFRYLRNEQVYEILLSYYWLFKRWIVKSSTLTKYLKLLWYFIVRSRFISINPSDYEKIFAQHCKEISTSDQGNISKYFDIFISKLKPYVSDDEQFIVNLVSDVKYGYDNKLINEILSTLIHKGNWSIQMCEPEIEHILPQKPIKWWYSESDIKEYVHKIWNLTLLFSWDNKEVWNENMDIKSKNFITSNFLFNKDISFKWAEKFKEDYSLAIEERSNYIANEISKEWKL